MNMTPGPWITLSKKILVDDQPRQMIIVVQSDRPERIIASTGWLETTDTDEDIANAAAISALPEAFEALIEIQKTLNTSKENIDLEKLNEVISMVWEKVLAEAGA